ncbi:MAG: ATP-binding protein [Alphaproteobacteria bacterium]|nr:ATP-binding protein [Alphaproteobacteria bacterium]
MLFRFVKLSLVFVLLSPAVASTSRIWNLPRQEINFIGREKQLMDLEDSLPKNHLVAIVGLAGIGKTSLAKEFALKHRESYQVVWFIDLKKDLDGQLHQLALELSRKKIISFEVSPYNVSEGVNTALSWLRSTEAGWLLIFDNVEKNVDISTSFPDLNNHPHKHVIVTTRYNPGWCKKLLLKSFSGKEAFEFLQHLLGDEYPMEELLKLASVLGNHPRALLQASSYIN